MLPRPTLQHFYIYFFLKKHFFFLEITFTVKQLRDTLFNYFMINLRSLWSHWNDALSWICFSKWTKHITTRAIPTSTNETGIHSFPFFSSSFWLLSHLQVCLWARWHYWNVSCEAGDTAAWQPGNGALNDSGFCSHLPLCKCERSIQALHTHAVPLRSLLNGKGNTCFYLFCVSLLRVLLIMHICTWNDSKHQCEKTSGKVVFFFLKLHCGPKFPTVTWPVSRQMHRSCVFVIMVLWLCTTVIL